ncbi:MAG: glycosyltransferase family 4 protein [Deferrisomatales bacterium]|nr:glycosyltransferase family 4 protein [Deferrisomatales bacterium]
MLDEAPQIVGSGKRLMAITLPELSKGLRCKRFWREALRASRIRLIIPGTMPPPAPVALVVWLLGRGRTELSDDSGECAPLPAGAVLSALIRMLWDGLARGRLLRAVRDDLITLEGEVMAGPVENRSVDLTRRPTYLRTDLWMGVRSGGSVGHIAGVLNNLEVFGAPPIFLTPGPVATVVESVEIVVAPPERSFWDFRELRTFGYNGTSWAAAARTLSEAPISFVYHRYSRNNYIGLKFAKVRAVPFVLEYNGSEVWIARNWGRRLKYEALTERIELLNLRGADVVVVVSRPMRDELVARGIDAEKILVNPNGVDPERYSPDVDGSAVRERHGLVGKTVIGFIGTFGRWHGAEVLAEAFGRLLNESPKSRESVRLLMIGDGLTMSETRQVLAKWGVSERAVLTGLVPQEEGPAHLAACDILAAPHVPNPDGTPFFGSPTKLFEYMAMGKGIVASDLDQIGEVLEHDRTGWLVRPGDAGDLAVGLRVLLEDRARRERLGSAAREAAVDRHTWREHTRRILEKLEDRCG